jgi:hypothetical protein
MYHKAIFPLVLCALAGCAQLDTKVNMDIAGATALATAVGDTQAATCYQALSPLVANPPAGLLSKFEVFRAGEAIAQGPCAPLVGQLAIHLLNKAPLAP